MKVEGSTKSSAKDRSEVESSSRQLEEEEEEEEDSRRRLADLTEGLASAGLNELPKPRSNAMDRSEVASLRRVNPNPPRRAACSRALANRAAPTKVLGRVVRLCLPRPPGPNAGVSEPVSARGKTVSSTLPSPRGPSERVIQRQRRSTLCDC